MKFYIAGRKIRDFDDLIEGEKYSVCGVVGMFRTALVPEGKEPLYVLEEDSEGLSLTITRTALLDRINMGFVYAIKKSWKPRPKTILKMMDSTKK